MTIQSTTRFATPANGFNQPQVQGAHAPGSGGIGEIKTT